MVLSALRTHLGSQALGALVIRATLGSAGLRIAGMGLSFLVGVQLARGLGTEGYGVYGLAMSVIALLNVPTQFGVPQVLTREVARAHASDDWPTVREVLSWANRLVVSSSLLVGVLGVLSLLGPFEGPNGFAPTLSWGLALIPLIALGNVRGGALRGLQRIVLGQLPEVIVRPAVFSLLLFVAFTTSKSITASRAMGLHVAAAGAAFCCGAWFLHRALPRGGRASFSAQRRRGLLRSAIPMALTEGMRVLQGHLAILLLGLLGSVAMVGLFRVATSTMALIATPITILNVVSAPIVARLHARGELARLRSLATAVAWTMLLGVVALSVPLLWAGEWLLGTAFGAEFEASLPSLLVLCAGQVVSAVFGANATLLNMSGHEGRVTRAFVVALIVNVLTAMILIPLRGDVGAATATALSMLTWNVIMWIDARRLVLVDTSVFAALWRPTDKDR